VEILYLLIPMSAVLVLLILGIFAWAVHRGQFEELEGEGERILVADDEEVDADQVPPQGRPEQSPGSQSGHS
jgi:cbb3-type cytochrome oxidase maturation protein